jgi:hypothetical protein
MVGCGGETYVPVVSAASPASRPGSSPTVVVVKDSNQTNPPAVVQTEAPPAAQPVLPPAVITPETSNTPSLNSGTTEIQPTASPENTAALLVDQSSRQASRLRSAWQTSDEARRTAISSVLANLEAQAGRVRQELQSRELASSLPGSEARMRLESDIGALRDALRASYVFAAPPDRALPQPSPIPPSNMRP